METYRSETIDNLIADYAADVEAGHKLAWIEASAYTAPAGAGVTVFVRPSCGSRYPKPNRNASFVSFVIVDIDDDEIGYIEGPDQPSAEELRSLIDLALAQSGRGAERERAAILGELRDAAGRKAAAAEELRDLARRAHAAGSPKATIADAASTSRPTLDRWLAE
ncbi:hypothetical protein [Agromyces archimandritae]|uniref:Uncharacterized protein n=1 Tax=Agromyces archimandritae TaxID=2781962 RepID=A0A975FLJ1_9MICO|nr:hypothetical protein [Agromyces archimandritae]QTX04122.1 hypothetical protein G127AT_12585 [Agromyces archimandritae]